MQCSAVMCPFACARQGPSINARPESIFSRVAAARLPLALWNVDNERQLDRALRVGGPHMIDITL